MMGIYKMQ